MRFLEHWLRDVDTGVTREPPVKLAIRHGGDRYVWRYENEWPILALDAVLPRRFCWVAHCHAGDKQAAARFRADAENPAVTFVTPPFEEETEITGPS